MIGNWDAKIRDHFHACLQDGSFRGTHTWSLRKKWLFYKKKTILPKKFPWGAILLPLFKCISSRTFWNVNHYCGQLWVWHIVCGQTCDGLYHFTFCLIIFGKSTKSILALKLSVSATITPGGLPQSLPMIRCHSKASVNKMQSTYLHF